MELEFVIYADGSFVYNSNINTFIHWNPLNTLIKDQDVYYARVINNKISAIYEVLSILLTTMKTDQSSSHIHIKVY